MADLIDRAALLADIDELHEHCGHCDGYGYISKDKTMQKLKAAPAVDAVPVVRCKDCNRNEKNGGDCNRTLTITERDYVLELNVSKYITLDYCSYGERKET